MKAAAGLAAELSSVFVRGPDGRWQVAYFRSLGPKPAGIATK